MYCSIIDYFIDNNGYYILALYEGSSLYLILKGVPIKVKAIILLMIFLSAQTFASIPKQQEPASQIIGNVQKLWQQIVLEK